VYYKIEKLWLVSSVALDVLIVFCSSSFCIAVVLVFVFDLILALVY